MPSGPRPVLRTYTAEALRIGGEGTFTLMQEALFPVRAGERVSSVRSHSSIDWVAHSVVAGRTVFVLNLVEGTLLSSKESVHHWVSSVPVECVSDQLIVEVVDEVAQFLSNDDAVWLYATLTLRWRSMERCQIELLHDAQGILVQLPVSVWSARRRFGQTASCRTFWAEVEIRDSKVQVLAVTRMGRHVVVECRSTWQVTPKFSDPSWAICLASEHHEVFRDVPEGQLSTSVDATPSRAWLEDGWVRVCHDVEIVLSVHGTHQLRVAYVPGSDILLRRTVGHAFGDILFCHRQRVPAQPFGVHLISSDLRATLCAKRLIIEGTVQADVSYAFGGVLFREGFSMPFSGTIAYCGEAGPLTEVECEPPVVDLVWNYEKEWLNVFGIVNCKATLSEVMGWKQSQTLTDRSP